MCDPWFDLHLQAELDYTGGGYTRRQAAALVRQEFANGPAPCACDCGGKAWYRPTVGAMQCPDCRALYRTGSLERVR